MLIAKEGMESEVEKIRSIANFLSTNLSDSPAPIAHPSPIVSGSLEGQIYYR